jgi:hypothetical protein
MSRRATHQLGEDTLVQWPLPVATLPQLLVVRLEALPVAAKLFQTVLVDVCDPVYERQIQRLFIEAPLKANFGRIECYTKGRSLHAAGTPGDLAPFAHAIELAAAIGLLPAHHKVVIIRLAFCPDEEARAHQRCGAGADFIDGWNRRGERGRIDEDLAVKPADTGRLAWGRRLFSSDNDPRQQRRPLTWALFAPLWIGWAD